MRTRVQLTWNRLKTTLAPVFVSALLARNSNAEYEYFFCVYCADQRGEQLYMTCFSRTRIEPSSIPKCTSVALHYKFNALQIYNAVQR